MSNGDKEEKTIRSNGTRVEISARFFAWALGVVGALLVGVVGSSIGTYTTVQLNQSAIERLSMEVRDVSTLMRRHAELRAHPPMEERMKSVEERLRGLERKVDE